MEPEITTEVVETLARVAGFEVPAEDHALLAAVLQNQLASVRRLEELDLGDVEPIVSFDPRWR
jgi:Asp-tRNA(Asn)/Glu-tRNA(Gln) amidotransferase C subunit